MAVPGAAYRIFCHAIFGGKRTGNAVVIFAGSGNMQQLAIQFEHGGKVGFYGANLSFVFKYAQ